MKIALINGSPKIKQSASGSLLEDIRGYVSDKAEIVEVVLHTDIVSEEKFEELAKADAWIFAYPLYVDGIPGHLLSCLMQLEKAGLDNPERHIYGIVNCGFYEGIQAEFALRLLYNFCEKAGFIYGGGIGVGGGGGLAMMPKMEPGKGPKAPIDEALQELINVVLRQKTQNNNYVSIAFPRFLYRMGAQRGWRQWIKANGGKTKDLANRPE